MIVSSALYLMIDTYIVRAGFNPRTGQQRWLCRKCGLEFELTNRDKGKWYTTDIVNDALSMLKLGMPSRKVRDCLRQESASLSQSTILRWAKVANVKLRSLGRQPCTNHFGEEPEIQALVLPSE